VYISQLILNYSVPPNGPPFCCGVLKERLRQRSAMPAEARHVAICDLCFVGSSKPSDVTRITFALLD
jgi:hypothetical protein